MKIDLKNLYECLIEYDVFEFFKDADYENIVVSKSNDKMYHFSVFLQNKYFIKDIDWILRICQYLAKYDILQTEIYLEKINLLNDEISNAYQAVDCLLLWNYMKEYEPSKETGFMFDNNKYIDLIWKKMESLDRKIYNNHSGTSMALTMRTIQFIAKNNVDKYLLERNYKK